MRLKPKQNCVDCHFFVKGDRENTLEIEAPERESARQGDYLWAVHYTLACSFGVWNEGHNFNQANRQQVIVETNRRDFCFWWKHHPAMLLPAAKILQEREARNRDSARDRHLTLYGLWIAAIALVINVWLTLAQKLKLWPFN